MNARVWWGVVGAVALIAAALVLLQAGVLGSVFGSNRRSEAEQRLVSSAGRRMNDIAFVGAGAGAPQYRESQAVFRDHLTSLVKAARDDLETYRTLSRDEAGTAPLVRFLDRYQQHLDAISLRKDADSQAEALSRLVSATAATTRDAAALLIQGPKGLPAAAQRVGGSEAEGYMARPARPLQVTTDKDSYGTREAVRVRVSNVGEETVDLPDTTPVAIYRETSPGLWERVARPSGSQTPVRLSPGQSLDVVWDNASGTAPGQFEARVLSAGWSDLAFTVRFTVR